MRWIVTGLIAAACCWLGGALPGALAQGYGISTPSSRYDPQALRVLAEQGDTRAAFLLAARYASGRDGIKDDSEAVRWFTVAAQAGLAEAQYNLGIMYASGRGVPRDEALAATWLQRAAGSGLPQAQYNLGVLYEHGRGVRLDARRALDWYQRAAGQGFAPARQRHAALSEKLGAAAVSAPAAPAGVSANAPPADRAAAPAVADHSDWVAGLDPAGFTLQLASYTDRADAQRFASSFPDGAPVGIYGSTKHGKRWFAVVHGVYPSHAQANAAVAALPERIRSLQPWARKIALIHAEMAQ